MGLKDGFELVGDVSLRANSGEIIKELNLVEKALESVANVAKGTGLEKYWKSLEDEAQRQKRLLEEVRLSYERFNSINSEETAAGLIKAVNALQAVGVTDLSPVINDLEKFRSVFSDAMQLTPNAESFSADNFRTLFDALDTLQNKGYDVRDILSRLSSSGDTEFLRKEVERLTEELNNAKNKTTVLNEELRKAKSSAGIDELESQIERLNDELGETEESLARVYNRAEREFDTFLKGHGIQPDEDEFSSYYENIRDGSETAMQAISRFRVEYQHLFDTNSRDVGAMAVIDSLNAKIETLTGDISYLTTAIKDMIDNGVKTAAGQASSSTQEMAGAFDALREAAQSLSGGGGGSGGGPNGPIDDIIEKLIRLASIDLSNLENTRAILLNIAKMSGTSISAATVKNLGALLESVKQFGAGGASIVIPDFTKLNELAIDKDQLKALASYLPKIADSSLDKLTVLKDVDFSKLNGISADKSVSSLARLIKELGGANLDHINTVLRDIDFSKFQETSIDDSFAKLASALSRLQRLDSQRLKDIVDLPWQNLNSIDIRDTAAQNIASLADSLTQLSQAREELQQIVEFVKEYQSSGGPVSGGPSGPTLPEELDEAGRKLESISYIYDKTKEDGQQLVGYTKNYVKELDNAVERSHDLYKVEYDEDGPKHSLVQQNVVDNYDAMEKAKERQAEADRKEQIAVNNLQRELTSYANTLTKTIYLAKQHGLGTTAETDALVKNRDTVISLRNSLDSLGTSGLKDVQTQFSGVRKEAESSRIAIENSVNSTKAQNQAALEYFRNIRQAESLKQQILKDISHSSKASVGVTAEDRKKLEQYAVQVDALSKKYEKGFLTTEQFSKELANLRNQATGAANSIRQAGEMTLSFGERIKKAASNLAYYFSISRVIMQVIRYMRDLVQQSIELDKQMGQLRIVTNETEEAYAGYADTIAKTAKEIGSSMTDLISATTTFARLGYSLDDSSILAKYTGMLQQVGDIDASSAQDAITAITKAFSDEVNIDNIESVMDRLVVAGNNFPISVSQLAEGMNNASSALAAAGNNLDESIALLAAANVTVQNASKSSTAVRTITARLRNSKAELDELGEEVMTTAKYQGLLNTLTKNNVEIVDKATGKYNSTYKIMSQLANVWGDLDDGIKATLTTQLAGVRNVDAFNSILANFKETAVGVMDAMSGSAGALESAYDTYLETVEAHVNSLKAAWQGLATSVFESDLINQVVDGGRTIIEVLDGIFDLLNLIGGVKTLAVGAQWVALARIAAGKEGIGAFTTAFRLARESGNNMFNSVTSGLNGLVSSVNVTRVAVVGLTTIIAGIARMAMEQKKAQQQAIEAGRDAAEFIDEVNRKNFAEKYEELYKSGDLEGIKSLQDEITAAVGKHAEGIDLVNGKYDEQIEKLRTIAAEAARDEDNVNALRTAYYSATEQYYAPTGPNQSPDQYKSIVERIETARASWEKAVADRDSSASSYKQTLDELMSSFGSMKAAAEDLAYNTKLIEVFDNVSDSVFKSKESVDEFVNGLTNFSFDRDLIDANAKGLLTLRDVEEIVRKIIATRYPEYVSLIYEGTTEAATETEQFASSLDELKEKIESLKDAYDLIAKAEKEMNQNGGISYDTLSALIKQYDNYSDYLYVTNGRLQVRTDLLEKEAEATYNSEANTLRNRIESLREEYKTIEEELNKPGAIFGRDKLHAKRDRQSAITEEIEAAEEELQNLDSVYNLIIQSSQESPFAKMYKEHQRLLALDREVSEDYIEWLRTASKEAYDNGWITLEELQKYEEEVHKGTPGLAQSITDLGKAYDTLGAARQEDLDSGKLSVSTIESIISATDKYVDVLEVENGQIKLNEDAWKQYYASRYEAAKQDAETYRAQLESDLSDERSKRDSFVSGLHMSEMTQEQVDTLNQYNEKIESLEGNIADVNKEIDLFNILSKEAGKDSTADIWSSLSGAIDRVSDSYSLIAKAREEMNSAGSLSLETINSIIDVSPEYIKFLRVENGLVKLNTKALRDLANEQSEAQLSIIDEAISERNKNIQAYRDQGLSDDSAEIKNELADIYNLESIRDIYKTSLEASRAVYEFKDALSELKGGYELLTTAQAEMSKNGALSISTIESIISSTDNYADVLKVENGQILLNERAWKDYYTSKYKAAKNEEEEKRNRLLARRAELIDEDGKALDGYSDELAELDRQLDSSNNKLAIFDAALNTLKFSTEAAKEQLSSYISDLSDATGDISSTYDALTEAQIESAGANGLSFETVEKILSISPEYVRFLSTEGGLIKLNADALKEYASAQYAAKIGEVQDKISALRKEQAALTSDDAEAYAAIQRQIDALEGSILLYQTIFDSLTNGFESIARNTSYIDSMRDSLSSLADVEDIVAKGFIVAADKVSDLSGKFPELFANAKAYADGSMKLDEEVAQNFLTNRTAETKASIESKITQLEAELEAVTAKKDLVDAQIQLAQDAALAEGQFDKDVAQYKIENADAVAQAAIDAGASEAQAYAIASQSMFDNTFDLDTAIATATSDISHNFGEAFATAADNSATNTAAINTNIDSVTSQSHEAATAVAGIPSGRVQGRSGVIKPGVAGSKKGANILSNTMVPDSGTGNVQAMMQGVYKALQASHVNLAPAEFTAKYFSSQIGQYGSLADLILSKIEESDALALLQDQLKGQIAVLRNLQKVDLSQFKDKDKTKSSSAGSGGGPSTSTSGKGGAEENPFAIMYKEHQHLLAMEQEEVGDYFAWLDKASRDAYEKGWITLDDLRKYEEEVYKGLKEIMSDAESAMNDLVEFRKKMLEKQYDDEKKNLQAQLAMLEAFYDDQKKQLQDQREEEEYQKEKAEKQRAVTDIEAELAMLGYDNSAKTQKRRLELQEELAKAQEEYAEFENDHAYSLAEEALESAYEKQKTDIERQIEAIEELVNDPNTLFNQALEDIKNDTGSLYAEMVAFAVENGEGESTVKRLWENAFIATQDLQTVTSENVQTIAELLADLPADIANLITGFTLQNSTGYSTTSKEATSSTSGASSGSGSSSASGGSSSSKIPVGTAVKGTGKAYATVKGTGNAVDITGKQLYVAQVWDNAANPYWQGDYTYAVAYSKGGSIIGWVRKDQLSGYASGTSFATAGMHRVDERGQEALFVSSNGNHYRLLSDGDKVFNAEATDFLYRFANKDKDVLRGLFDSMFSQSALSKLANRQTIGDVRMGDINIYGNADKATVSEIRRAQREGVDNLLQQFGRLQRAAR